MFGNRINIRTVIGQLYKWKGAIIIETKVYQDYIYMLAKYALYCAKTKNQ